MKQSTLFPKTKREPPKDARFVNHKFLVQAGFIDQLMSGSWTLLPLGWRVVSKINQIIREEINSTGALEVLMPLLHPKDIWSQTGRWDKAGAIMYQFKDAKGKEYALSFTHEEIVLDLIRKNLTSYKDLPIKIYHFSTKFRNEPRARSGILRGREFLMNDLYSAHATQDDLDKYYQQIKMAYSRIFSRIGFDFKIVEAGGGVFTQNRTHEFQVLAESGEDTIYYCNKCDWGVNREIFEGKVNDRCDKCKSGKILESRAIEIGNIFRFGTVYSQQMQVYFIDKDGEKKPVWFGSYGIGTTRLVGAWVEVSHDKRGIIWNKTISPFDVHLLEVRGKNTETRAEQIYQDLSSLGIDVLFDDRNISAGEKFADADLIGIPIRLVISESHPGKIEWKERDKEKFDLLDFEQIIKRIKE